METTMNTRTLLLTLALLLTAALCPPAKGSAAAAN